MATSSTHIRKRQYQPSHQTYLNSYFVRRDAPALQRSGSLSPALPADTAASLLSVGMRVRKSVPEGYKTHKTLGSPGSPFAASTPSTSSSAPARPVYSPVQTRELTPFCGLHKVGGLAAQEVPSSAPAIMRTDYGNDDVPALSTSQGSFMSTQNGFAALPRPYAESKKRGYEDEADDDMDAFFDEQDDADMVISQQSAAVRPMARFKGSTPRKAPQQHGVRIFGSDDFEEAPFLMPMDMEQ